MYVGSEYYIGFIPNDGAPPLIVMLYNGEGLAAYTIEAPVTQFSRNGAITANVQNIINLPNALTGLSSRNDNALDDEYKEGVYLQTSRNQIAAIGLSNGREIFDTFFVIPTVDLCLYEYTYFAVSVTSNYNADGSIVIVGTTDQTTVNITVPVSAVQIKISNSADWGPLYANTLYSYEIQRLQIVYIAAYTTDLTGTKVTTNKPISLFSGHECSYVPSFVEYCNNLAEQIPPTELWGTVYYFAPLASRTSYIIKIIAAYNSTTVEIRCNNNDRTLSFRINAGENTIETFDNQEYCRLFASQEVLVAQFSYGYERDSRGDPMMMLIPPTAHYTNSITSSTFQPSTQVNSYDHYINIIALASYDQRQMISVTAAGGVNRSSNSLNWVTAFSSNDIEVYAAQVNIPHGVFEVTHFNKSVLMTVMVYGFEVRAVTGSTGGYGHPGWLMAQLNAGMHICKNMYVCIYFMYFIDQSNVLRTGKLYYFHYALSSGSLIPQLISIHTTKAAPITLIILPTYYSF